MHVRELVETAAIVAEHGQLLLVSPAALPADSLEQYWSASKCRLDRWTRTLKAYSRGASDDIDNASQLWGGIRPVLEEILVSEILARLWSGLAVAHDRQRKVCESGPIVRSVMNGHLEARHRALGLMVDAPGIGADQAVGLNRLRRRTERWSDVLLGYLVEDARGAEFAVDADRMREFSDDLSYQRRQRGGSSVWPLVGVSLRVAFHRGLCESSPNADLNARVAGSILSCFSGDLFDSTGLFRSLWLLRMSATTGDVAGMVEDLLQFDPPHAATAQHPAPSSNVEQQRRRFPRN